MESNVSSLYIHFPYCKSFCNYCDFYSCIPQDASFSVFHEQIESQWKIVSEKLDSYKFSLLPLETLYLGGGTPSLWGVQGIEFLSHFLQAQRIALAPQCEFTLEVNPGAVSIEEIERWRELGVNRFSVGVQAYDAEALLRLGRTHSLEEVDELLSYLGKKNYNFSVDLLLGIPYQGRNLQREIEGLLQFSPTHLSSYILTVGEDYCFYNDLPGEDQTVAEYLFLVEELSQRGLLQYEVSNFSLIGKESRHNQAYWEQKSVLALGPSATGYLALSKNSAYRYKWTEKDLTLEEEFLSKAELYEERVFLALRTQKGIPLGELDSSKQKIIEEWGNRNLLKSLDPVVLTSNGFLLMDSLVLELL